MRYSHRAVLWITCSASLPAGSCKRWRNAEMALRWTAAGMMEVQKSFRRLKAYRQLPILRMLCLSLIPSDLATLDPCNSRPYAHGRHASINSREESKDFCGRRSLREGQGRVMVL